MKLRQIFKILLLHVLALEPSEIVKEEIERLSEDIQDFSECFDKSHYADLFRFHRRVMTQMFLLQMKQGEFNGFIQLIDICFMNLSETDTQNILIDDVLEFFAFVFQPSFLQFPSIIPFYKSLISKIIKKGEKTKLLHRSLVNTLLTLFSRDSHLIAPFAKPLFELLLIKEYRGYESEELHTLYTTCIPPINALKPLHTDFHGLYPRFTLFYLFENLPFIPTVKQFLLELFHLIVDWNHLHKKPYLPFTEIHKKKIPSFQALLLFKKFIIPSFIEKEEINFLKAFLLESLQDPNLPSIRVYNEMLCIHLFQQYPEFYPELIGPIEDPNIKNAFAISMTLIVGYLLLHSHFESELFEKYFNLVMSHTALQRAIAQYYVYQILKKQPHQGIYGQVFRFLEDSKSSQTFLDYVDSLQAKISDLVDRFSLDTLFGQKIDEQGEVLHESVIDLLKEGCNTLQTSLVLDDQTKVHNIEYWRKRVKDITLP